MQSRVKTVTEYMHEVPVSKLDALTELRELCLQTLKGFKESMEYGMPSYSRDHKVEVAFNSQKDFISLYILNPIVLKKFKDSLKSLDVGKSCIRYKNVEKMDYDLIGKILLEVKQTPLSSAE